jgi:Fic family protein
VTEQGDWAGWVSFILTGVRETSKWTLASIIQLNKAIDEAADLSRTRMKSGYSRELIDLIFKHPYCKIGHLVDAGIAGRVTASRYLNQLEKLGILTSIQIHRDKYFINTAIMRSLDVPLPERND